MELDGQVAVVSGDGSGIGRAAVLALTQRGANVVVADIGPIGGEATVAMTNGGASVFARCDVTKTRDLAAAFALAWTHFGRFDIAFNNAGDEDLFNDDAGKWMRVIDIDLTAVIDATRIAVTELKKAAVAASS